MEKKKTATFAEIQHLIEEEAARAGFEAEPSYLPDTCGFAPPSVKCLAHGTPVLQIGVMDKLGTWAGLAGTNKAIECMLETLRKTLGAHMAYFKEFGRPLLLPIEWAKLPHDDGLLSRPGTAGRMKENIWLKMLLPDDVPENAVSRDFYGFRLCPVLGRWDNPAPMEDWMLEILGIPEKELFETAGVNTNKMYPAKLMRVSEALTYDPTCLSGTYGMLMDGVPEYVLTNAQMRGGLAALLQQDAIREAREAIGSDFYLWPYKDDAFVLWPIQDGDDVKSTARVLQAGAAMHGGGQELPVLAYRHGIIWREA